MKEQTQQQGDTSINADGTLNSNYSNKIITRYNYAETGIWIVGYEGKPWFAAVAEYKILEKDTEEELIKTLEEKPLSLLIMLTCALVQKARQIDLLKITDIEVLDN